MNSKKILFSALIIILILAVGLLSLKLYFYQQEIVRLQNESEIHATNAKVLDFAKLFIEKVLASKQEVDFETRLSLENMIRDVNDQGLFDQWTKFTQSKTTEEGQENVVELLKMLMEKISVK